MAGKLTWCVSCVQEKREEYHRAQREKEDREIEEKKQAAREQVELCVCYCMYCTAFYYIHSFTSLLNATVAEAPFTPLVDKTSGVKVPMLNS